MMAKWNDWVGLVISTAFLKKAPEAVFVQTIATLLSIDAGTLHAFAHPHWMAAPGEAARRARICRAGRCVFDGADGSILLIILLLLEQIQVGFVLLHEPERGLKSRGERCEPEATIVKDLPLRENRGFVSGGVLGRPRTLLFF